MILGKPTAQADLSSGQITCDWGKSCGKGRYRCNMINDVHEKKQFHPGISIVFCIVAVTLL